MGVYGNATTAEGDFPKAGQGFFYSFGEEALVCSRSKGAIDFAMLLTILHSYFNIDISINEFEEPSSIQHLETGESIIYVHALQHFLSRFPNIKPYFQRLLHILTPSSSPSLNNQLICAACGASVHIGDWGTDAHEHIKDFHKDAECFFQCDIHQQLLITLDQASAHVACHPCNFKPITFQYWTTTRQESQEHDLQQAMGNPASTSDLIALSNFLSI
jgi:hypothetical protein